MNRGILAIFVAALASAAGASALAQGGGGASVGANSDANQCKSRIEQVELLMAQKAGQPAGQSSNPEAAEQIRLAKAALARTEPIRCLTYADKALDLVK